MCILDVDMYNESAKKVMNESYHNDFLYSCGLIPVNPEHIALS